MLIADSLKVGVDLMALIGGDVKIVGLEAVNPSILLEKSADGRVNWELGADGVAPSDQPSGRSEALALSLDRALISGGRLRYVDHGAGSAVTVDDIALDLRWPVYRGAAGFDLSARFDAAPALAVAGDMRTTPSSAPDWISSTTSPSSVPTGRAA